MGDGGRRLVFEIFKNFWKSLQPRQMVGNKIGKDYFGNTYYEVPSDPSRGKRKPSRWFTPQEKTAFDQELPAEWESWLRFRRVEPPTDEEVAKNVQIMEMKKKNALELEAKFKPKQDLITESPKTGFESFPKYDEYEYIPGDHHDKKNKR